MPADHGVRFADHEHILPSNLSFPQDVPEQPVQRSQGRPGPSPFENGHLLAQGEEFERRVGAPTKIDAGGRMTPRINRCNTR